MDHQVKSIILNIPPRTYKITRVKKANVVQLTMDFYGGTNMKLLVPVPVLGAASYLALASVSVPDPDTLAVNTMHSVQPHTRTSIYLQRFQQNTGRYNK